MNKSTYLVGEYCVKLSCYQSAQTITVKFKLVSAVIALAERKQPSLSRYV